MGNSHSHERPLMMKPRLDHPKEEYNDLLARFLHGYNLESIIDNSSRYFHPEVAEPYTRPLFETCYSLMGFDAQLHLDLDDNKPNDSAECPSREWVLFFKVFFAVYMGDYYTAEVWVCQLKNQCKGFRVSRQIETQVIFFQGLIAAVLASRGASGHKRHRLSLAQRSLRKLQAEKDDPRLWNKICLLEAQLQACHGRHEAALLLFHKSMELAEHEGFTHEQGLAYELAGAVCQACSRDDEADLYLSQARAFYGQWGASVKVEQLERRTS